MGVGPSPSEPFDEVAAAAHGAAQPFTAAVLEASAAVASGYIHVDMHAVNSLNGHAHAHAPAVDDGGAAASQHLIALPLTRPVRAVRSSCHRCTALYRAFGHWPPHSTVHHRRHIPLPVAVRQSRCVQRPCRV